MNAGGLVDREAVYDGQRRGVARRTARLHPLRRLQHFVEGEI
jgi:hypothetical protein